MENSKILDDLIKIARETPNDQDLGSKIRSYINFINTNSISEDLDQLMLDLDFEEDVDAEVIDLGSVSENLKVG